MKKTLLVSALALAFAPLLHADDVALLQIKVGKTKVLKPVAIELYEGDAPATVENFKKLAKKKFYDGVAFHRVFPHTLLQTGDPLSKKKDRIKVGTGGPGYTIPPEIRRKHGAGAVAMARLPDKINPARMSNGSQFFVTVAATPWLDGRHAIFGEVVEGMDVVNKISKAKTGFQDRPVEDIVIKKLTIVRE